MEADQRDNTSTSQQVSSRYVDDHRNVDTTDPMEADQRDNTSTSQQVSSRYVDDCRNVDMTDPVCDLEDSSECDSTINILSIVASLIIVIIGSLINIIICRRNRKNSCFGSKSFESNVKVKTVQEMLPNFCRSDRLPYTVLGPLEKPNTYDDLHLYVEPVVLP
ncbi:uncharacterized protein LOC133204986 [Saccostrea echinata]|uniref:uncharacterized protein LOC133204986 n=1 Tax=Saccostrea echinata TaxID=191078 RepID=UPI002A82CC51|nr:uncharacterized protein LOC133204986 [Saccostrea echinata]